MVDDDEERREGEGEGRSLRGADRSVEWCSTDALVADRRGWWDKLGILAVRKTGKVGVCALAFLDLTRLWGEEREREKKKKRR